MRGEWIYGLLILLAGCSFGDEPGICPYNVRMEYWYAGSAAENVLPIYVDNIRQYLFDEKGALLATETLHGDSVAGWNAKLKNGTYTLVVWGNMGKGKNETTTVTTKNENNMREMQLSAAHTGVPPGYRNNTQRLYYGTTTFTLKDGVTKRQNVYLSHAHAVLKVTVRWRTEKQPPLDGNYRMRLKGIPDTYDFTGGAEEPTPSGTGTYTIPHSRRSVTYHETRAAVNYDHEVSGDFITFRYTSDTHQLWSLWRGEEQLIRDLDLSLFFAKLPMNMERNFEQEFDLLVTVYDNEIIVTQATAADWAEGGTIG